MTQTLAPMSWQALSLRLGCALLVGTVIGWEREAKSKPAGLRTNMLVSFGSALFILVPIQIGAVQQNIDILGRIISGVISGVGFIGAGTIFRGSKVHGLTSAAAIWISAALGVTVACGLWRLGLLGALVTWIILRLFNAMEKRWLCSNSLNSSNLAISLTNGGRILSNVFPTLEMRIDFISRSHLICRTTED